MVRFYDPRDRQDLDRTEMLLRKAGVEYFLIEQASENLGPAQVLVAEEDVPRAELALSEGVSFH